MSGLREVILDGPPGEETARTRQEEWNVAIHDMLGDPELKFREGGVRLTIRLASHETFLELSDAEGTLLASVALPRTALSEHLTEYVDIVRQISGTGEGRGSARLEALDMAKKLAHDDAARTLRRALRPLGPNHATCRRLWTLLFALRVDTRHLTGFRPNRRFRG